jgi:hypothetical protein
MGQQSMAYPNGMRLHFQNFCHKCTHTFDLKITQPTS